MLKIDNKIHLYWNDIDSLVDDLCEKIEIYLKDKQFLNTGKLFVSLIHQIAGMPSLIIQQINKVYQGKDLHNSLLYKPGSIPC